MAKLSVMDKCILYYMCTGVICMYFCTGSGSNLLVWVISQVFVTKKNDKYTGRFECMYTWNLLPTWFFMLDLLHNIIITNLIVEVKVHEGVHGHFVQFKFSNDANWVKYGHYSKP